MKIRMHQDLKSSEMKEEMKQLLIQTQICLFQRILNHQCRQACKKLAIIALFLLISMIKLGAVNAEDCDIADFPKVWYSNDNNNQFLQLEYHEDSELLCACGITYNYAINSLLLDGWSPFVICYQGDPSYDYKWDRHLQTSNQLDQIYSIAISSDGALVVTQSVTFIGVWNANDGNLVNARSFTGIDMDSEDYMFRNMIVGSGGYVYVANFRWVTYGTPDYFRIIKFQLNPYSSSIIWGKQSAKLAPFLNPVPVSLIFGEQENEIYLMIAENLTSNKDIVKMSSSTGEILQSFKLANMGVKHYQLMQFASFSSSSHMIITISGDISEGGPFYVRILLENGSIIKNEALKENNQVFSSIIFNAMRIVDKDNVITLNSFQQSLGTDLLIYISTISFLDQTITHRKQLPKQQFYGQGSFLGRFRSDDKFFLIGNNNRLYLRNFFCNLYGFHNAKGIILTNMDQSMQCIMRNEDEGIPDPPIIHSMMQQLNPATVISLTTATNFIDISSALLSTQYPLTLVQSVYMGPSTEEFFQGCCWKVNSLQYLITSAQTQKSFTVTQGFDQLIDISPFTASLVCGSIPPYFSFKGVNGDLYGTPLPTFLTIEQLTGSIEVASNSVIGTYPIKISGKLTNGQKMSDVFTLTVLSSSGRNKPPYFLSSLNSQTLALNFIKTYQLPSFTDPESDNISITTYQYGTVTLPSFVAFDSLTNTFTFSPIAPENIGTTQLRVKLDDSQNQSLYKLIVVVINAAPFVYSITIPASLTVSMNTDNIYTFAADGNTLTVITSDETNSGQPSYIVVNPSSINIKATQFSEVSITHYVKFSLSDGQFSTPIYSFDVTFTNSAPTFDTAPEDQTLILNSEKYYQLPTCIDLEGNVVFATLQSQPTFVTLVGSILKMNPTDENMIGSHLITIALSDGEPQVSTYTINVEVVADPNKSSSINFIPEVINYPPTFSSGLLDPLVIIVGDISNFTLPLISDIENDTVSLSVELADCIPFSTYFEINHTIRFMPQIANARQQPYKITIKLKDNVSLMLTQYNLEVFIQNISSIQQDLNSTNSQQQQQTNTSNETSNSLQRIILQVVKLNIIEITSAGQAKIQITCPNQTLSQLITEYILENQLIGKVYPQNETDLEIQILERITQQSILVCQLNFNTSQLFSQGNELDQLLISFAENITIIIGTNIELFIKQDSFGDSSFIPSQQSVAHLQLLQKIEDTAFYVESGFLPALIILSFIMPFILPYVCNLLSDLQFLMMLCLISMNMPGIVQDLDRCKRNKLIIRAVKVLTSWTSRLCVQFYCPIMLATAISLASIEFEEGNVSSIMAIIVVIFIHCSILTLFGKMKKQFQQQDDYEEILQSYKPLLERLKQNDGFFQKFWMFIQIIRWSITISILVFLKDSFILQVVLLQITSLAMVILIISTKPFDLLLDHIMQIVNELLAQSYLYAVISLTEFQRLDLSIRTRIGTVQIGIVTCACAINLIKAIYSLGCQCRKKWKQRNLRQRSAAVPIKALKTTQQYLNETRFKEQGGFQTNAAAIIEPQPDQQNNYLPKNEQEVIQQEEIKMDENHEEVKEAVAVEGPPEFGWLQKNDLLPDLINKIYEDEERMQKEILKNQLSRRRSLPDFTLQTDRMNDNLTETLDQQTIQQTSRANSQKNIPNLEEHETMKNLHEAQK